MPPLVSIVTPSYNQEKFLEAALLSVIDQDYPDLEYLVVDGGSQDGSKEIIQKYEQHLAWWVSEADQGQADAINKGFQRSTGEIIGWLNSDDLYFPWTVTEAVEWFQDHPQAGMVFGNAVSADAEGNYLNKLEFDSRDLVDLLKFEMICQPAVFMKRAVLEQSGFLDQSYDFFLDHHLWIQIARHAELVHAPRYWAVSRYHDQAKNITMAAECGDEVYRILSWAEEQQDLQPLLERFSDQIWAGAYQIHARYELDGGNFREAFQLYLRAASRWLPSLSGYWHRLLFSFLGLLGLGRLGEWYYKWKHHKPAVIPALEEHNK